MGDKVDLNTTVTIWEHAKTAVSLTEPTIYIDELLS